MQLNLIRQRQKITITWQGRPANQARVSAQAFVIMKIDPSERDIFHLQTGPWIKRSTLK
jgi:hypothetical protein